MTLPEWATFTLGAGAASVLWQLLILWREAAWGRERRDLINRLTARNPSEYVALRRATEREPTPKPRPYGKRVPPLPQAPMPEVVSAQEGQAIVRGIAG